MKKTCFVLLCALLLGFAPSTFAAEAVALGPFEALLAQLVALFSDSAETGIEIPPNGYTASGEPSETGEASPQSGYSDSGELLESAEYVPPGGYSDSGELLESAEYVPPGG